MRRPDDLACNPFRAKAKSPTLAPDPLLGQDTVNPPDDVVPLADRSKRRLRTIGAPPLCCTERLNQAKPVELAHSSNHKYLRRPYPAPWAESRKSTITSSALASSEDGIAQLITPTVCEGLYRSLSEVCHPVDIPDLARIRHIAAQRGLSELVPQIVPRCGSW